MAIDVKIPPMGESITSGVLAKWHVKDGDLVKKDQPLFELGPDPTPYRLLTTEHVSEVKTDQGVMLAVHREGLVNLTPFLPLINKASQNFFKRSLKTVMKK